MPVKKLPLNLMQPPNTNSIAWPDAVAEKLIPAHSGDPSSESSAEIAQAQLGLLADLEASLGASQQAVLSRDLQRLEQLTAEQQRLRQALALALERDPFHGTLELAPDALTTAVRSAQERVLHLGRVQLLLLAHAQRSLQVLSHLLAGPQAPYAPGQRALAARLPSPHPFSSEEV
jgi:hypothetical protein